MLVTVTSQIDENYLIRLEQLAQSSGRTQSALIAEAIIAYLNGDLNHAQDSAAFNE
ncbi:MAG: ribbon-helix-helix domain-containing protein, partial [Deferribacteraceae bacterium]|nr:ribbon-helix-helix domain-containing protein [Deferribacteraceae bacterium]